jgi:hypothetical protein
VRVLIHEIVLEEPLRQTRYPEPDYDGVGRARILHVFRDRGGEPERERTPKDRGRLPAPRLPRLLPA